MRTFGYVLEGTLPERVAQPPTPEPPRLLEGAGVLRNQVFEAHLDLPPDSGRYPTGMDTTSGHV
jgi:hypothetical protein